MLALLAEAALRSTALGAFAWLGLKLMRVRHPQLQMTVWTVVLLISLTMPILMPCMTIPLPPAVPRTVKITWIELPGITDQMPQKSEHIDVATPPPPDNAAPAPPVGGEWQSWAIGLYLYLFVSGAMLLRLLVGLTLMRHVVRAARGVRNEWGEGDIRISSVVTVPVTFTSTILLPVGYSAWDARKLRAVLLHERSHVVHGDFYVLLLASFNRALFWFSPFTWWLFIRLGDLAEAVSDDAAIAGLDGDRDGYADVLAEMAVAPQRLPAGLAMAHPRTVHRRILRIFAESSVPRRIGWRRRFGLAAALIPLAALSAVTVAQDHAPDSAALIASADRNAAIGAGSNALDRYVGRFQVGVATLITVTRAGDRLFAQWSGQPTLELTQTGEHEFVNEPAQAHVSFASFIKDSGIAYEARLREPGVGQVGGTRVDAATAAEIEATFRRRDATRPDRFRDQTPMPGGEAMLARTIEALRGGAVNERDMTGRLSEKLRGQLSMFHRSLPTLGALEQIVFRGVGPGGYDVYTVTFASGRADFRISPAADGRLEDVNFYPVGDGRRGGLAACTEESTLQVPSSSAPIKLLLINRSGGEVQVFWRNPAGKRVPYGTIENDASMRIWSLVDRPYVIADPAGRCRDILLPGEATRVHVIEPLGVSAEPRATPLPGSREALARHIDAVRRGAPDYDQMTAEVAAETRLYLTLQQALLARLGTLQELLFSGVSLAGNDTYTAKFANGSVTWQIGLLDRGRIGAVGPGPEY
jgi:beta-lactamase regulating signal transducer with metallopeptidase domain